MAEKKDKKTQTKAGMLKNSEQQSDNENDKTASNEESENLPKMSKQESEKRTDDRPIH